MSSSAWEALPPVPRSCGGAALHYVVERAWPVFPIRKGTKAPRWRHGVKDATTDLDALRSHYRRFPHDGVAIACGQASRLVVIDLDGPEGKESLAALEAEAGEAFPDTLTVATGKGLHLYYIWQHGIGNRTRIRPGLDVRGEGGYVIAPPTIHPDTLEPYAWLIGDLQPAALPAWFAPTISPPPVPARYPRRPVDPASAVDNLVAWIASRGPGTRNDSLYWAANRLLEENGDPWALLDAAIDVGLPEPEARRTIQSAIRRERTQ